MKPVVFALLALAAPATGLLATGAASPAAPQDSQAQDPFRKDAPRPKDVAALFELFTQLEGLEVSFVEEKHLALLVEPLTSSGKLYFTRPGHLTRVTEKPKPSTVRIGPKKLTVADEDGEEVVDLRQNEAVRVFVTSLVRIFGGDREALAKFYKLEYRLDDEDARVWHLELTPLKKPLTDMVKTLHLHGRGAAVERIEITEPKGDRSVTRVTQSNPRREFTDKEYLELFGLRADAVRGGGR